jgi:hypothetical protein
MRIPLKKFTEFTNALLPMETEYLLSIQQFEDEERLAILRQIDYNVRNIGQFVPYDTAIDKRKYNHLQNWIQARLQAIDVDQQFNQLLDWERQISNDTIQAEDEKELLKTIKKYSHPSFSFSKFFELVENYRHFLLIRLRYRDHQLADKFLKRFRASYLQARSIKEKLHEATVSIVGQHSGKGGASEQWEGWLSEVFYNEKLEGGIRYLALVRLVFICHNYKKYDLLKDKFEYLDHKLNNGAFYSKRLLLNYYNIRLMMHSHFREYDKAVHYGYLSVRAKTHDFLLYVNNLSAVLLRLHRQQEALQLMQKAASDAKKTKNFYNRIGFVAFYMKASNKSGLSKNAEQYGDSFLRAYSKEILQYRWHLFFSVYLEAIFLRNHYEKLLKIARKYRLSERDEAYRDSANYLPIIPIYIEAARLKEGELSQQKFLERIDPLIRESRIDNTSTLGFLLEDIKNQISEISSRLQKQ